MMVIIIGDQRIECSKFKLEVDKLELDIRETSMVSEIRLQDRTGCPIRIYPEASNTIVIDRGPAFE